MQVIGSLVALSGTFTSLLCIMYLAIICWSFMDCQVDPSVPGRFEVKFRKIIFKLILQFDGWDISCEIALGWLSLDLADDISTLFQTMAWCHRAKSHHMSQCWLTQVYVTISQGHNQLKHKYTRKEHVYLYQVVMSCTKVMWHTSAISGHLKTVY